MSEETNKGLILELAAEPHLPLLMAFQQAFHQYTPAEKSEYSFAYAITNDPFSEEDFRNIISKKECVILVDGDIPVGYMLIDSCSTTQALKDYQQAVISLIEEDHLDNTQKLAPRYAELLNPSIYQEGFRELRWQMLAYLIYCNKEKYDGLLYGFFTNADTLLEKLNLGWKIAFDNGMYFFLVWEFSQLDDQ